jgi:DNA helicase-2/ATP-dependent DNA helicase PcrA
VGRLSLETGERRGPDQAPTTDKESTAPASLDPTWDCEQVEEERRLLYVGMTRVKEHLHLVEPMRLFRGHQHRHGDGHVLAMRSRFAPDSILDAFGRRAYGRAIEASASATGSPVRVDVTARMRQMWD